MAGVMLGLVGAGVSAGSVAAGLTATEYGFMVSTADLLRVLLASALAGGVGAGIGAFIRNASGAVTGTIALLIIVPPLADAAGQVINLQTWPDRVTIAPIDF